MKRTCWFIVNVISLFFTLQAYSYNKDPDNSFTISPESINVFQAFPNSNQSDQFQLNQYHQDLLFTLDSNSFQNFYQYQQLRTSVLNRCIQASCNGQKFMIMPEDIQLINLICKDNPHYNHKKLAALLAQSSAFNYTQQFLKGDDLLGAFKSNIFINPDHFKSVSNSKYRLNQVIHIAKKVMECRHKTEKDNIKAQHKSESKAARKVSKQEKTKIENHHKQELATLQKKQK